MPASACRAPAALFQKESPPTDTKSTPSNIMTNNNEEHDDHSSIWTMIQSHNSPTPNAAAAYVRPLMHGSPSLMSKSSLEMCTESLGSENGSGDFSEDEGGMLNSFSGDEEVSVKLPLGDRDDENPQLSVFFNCSDSRRSPAPRSFPPPLTSISCHDGNCIQMRTRRQNGRLVVDAVPVASPIFLHAHRQDRRLLLSFIDSSATTQPNTYKPTQKLNQSQEETVDKEEDEEEVEVLDRRSMVELKVSKNADPTDRQCKKGAPITPRHQQVCRRDVTDPPEQVVRARRKKPPQRPLGGILNSPVTPTSDYSNHHCYGGTCSLSLRFCSALSSQHRFTATTTDAATTAATVEAVAASSASTSSQLIGQQIPLIDK